MTKPVITRKQFFIKNELDGNEPEFDANEFCCLNPIDSDSDFYIHGLPVDEPRCIKYLKNKECYKSCEECWNQPIKQTEANMSIIETNKLFESAPGEQAVPVPYPYIIAQVPQPTIPGLAPDVPVTTNANGGKQSSTPYGFHLLPTSSIFAAAEVAAYGANKYGEDFHNRNYIKIPVEDHINHCIQHLYGYLAGDTSDDHLGHAIVRAMFAYDVAQRNKETKHV